MKNQRVNWDAPADGNGCRRQSPPLLPLLALMLVALLLPSCAKKTTAPSFPLPSGRPPGLLYLITENPVRIYRYDIAADQLTILAEGDPTIQAFSVSYDGRALSYVAQDSLIELLRLPDLNRTTLTPAHRPGALLTVGSRGTLIAYEAQRPLGSTVNLLFPESGADLPFTSTEEDSSRLPLFSRSGDFLAWRQRDGLFIARTSVAGTTQLSTLRLQPGDFSPADQFLTSNLLVFDIITDSELPARVSGAARFLDETTLVFQETDSRKIFRIDVGGGNRRALTAALESNAAFSPDPDGRFLAYFRPSPGGARLIILDINLNEDAIDQELGIGSGSRVVSVFWRAKPSAQ